jgi:hypothetical protein
MGWMICLFFIHRFTLPYVNQHSTTVNLFWLLTFDHLGGEFGNSNAFDGRVLFWVAFDKLVSAFWATSNRLVPF